MSDFFDHFEAQLHAAARARVGARHAEPWWRRSRLHMLPMVAGAAVAVAVAIVALALTGHGHPNGSPAAPGGPTRQEVAYIREAAVHVRRTDPGCSQRRPRIPAVIHGSPGQALLSVLGVLRRPSRAADMLPSGMIGNGTPGIYVGYTRRARVVAGVSYYVVPVFTASQSVGLSARCASEIAAAVRAELPRIPASLRAPTLSLTSRLLAGDRAANGPSHEPGICLMVTGAASTGGTCAATATQLQRFGLLASVGRLSGVVPDGVAAVTLRYPAFNRHRARTITARVVGNVFATPYRSDLPLPSGQQRPAMTWRSADGSVIETVPGTGRLGFPGNSGFCSSRSRNGCR